MDKKHHFSLVFTASFFLPGVASALALDEGNAPGILVGGHFIGTSHYITQPDGDREVAAININNSSILLGFDKKLFQSGFGESTFGVRQTHDGLQFHQLNGAVEGEHLRASIGLMNLRNHVIDFPTLRNDDLLTYTHMLNGEEDHHSTDIPEPFNEMDQLYGKTVTLGWQFDNKQQSLEVWSSERQGHGDYNTIGAGYFYHANATTQAPMVKRAGILVDRQQVADHDAWLTAYIAGIDLNLRSNPDSNWSAALQAISSEGSIKTESFESYIEMAKHSAYSIVASLGYNSHPIRVARWQTAMTFAAKQYHEVPNAWQWSIVPTATLFLGRGVALNGQLSYTDNDSALNQGVSEVKIEFGMSFNMDNKLNNQATHRHSMLTGEHANIL